MSNRDDFDRLTEELIDMFHLDGDCRNCLGDTLRWRLERELHNAFVAGQESNDSDENMKHWSSKRGDYVESKELDAFMDDLVAVMRKHRLTLGHLMSTGR